MIRHITNNYLDGNVPYLNDFELGKYGLHCYVDKSTNMGLFTDGVAWSGDLQRLKKLEQHIRYFTLKVATECGHMHILNYLYNEVKIDGCYVEAAYRSGNIEVVKLIGNILDEKKVDLHCLQGAFASGNHDVIQYAMKNCPYGYQDKTKYIMYGKCERGDIRNVPHDENNVYLANTVETFKLLASHNNNINWQRCFVNAIHKNNIELLEHLCTIHKLKSFKYVFTGLENYKCIRLLTKIFEQDDLLCGIYPENVKLINYIKHEYSNKKFNC